MEELTKTQIVLLTLLISFVTSIATGIVTVALVDQSSAGVGQTIQTVIQRTIETVVPGTVTEEKPITIKTNPPTPLPSESDLIVQAVTKSSATLVRIKKANVSAGQAFVGLAVVISKDGLLLTDRSLLIRSPKYIAVFPDGKTAPLTPADLNSSSTHAAFFSFTPPEGENLAVASLGNSDGLSLGQKVISLSGADKDVVQIGSISSFDKGSTDNNKAFINTDFDVSTKAFGSILVNLAGEVIGMKTGASSSGGFSYQGINLLKSEIK